MRAFPSSLRGLRARRGSRAPRGDDPTVDQDDLARPLRCAVSPPIRTHPLQPDAASTASPLFHLSTPLTEPSRVEARAGRRSSAFSARFDRKADVSQIAKTAPASRSLLPDSHVANAERKSGKSKIVAGALWQQCDRYVHLAGERVPRESEAKRQRRGEASPSRREAQRAHPEQRSRPSGGIERSRMRMSEANTSPETTLRPSQLANQTTWRLAPAWLRPTISKSIENAGESSDGFAQLGAYPRSVVYPTKLEENLFRTALHGHPKARIRLHNHIPLQKPRDDIVLLRQPAQRHEGIQQRALFGGYAERDRDTSQPSMPVKVLPAHRQALPSSSNRFAIPACLVGNR